MIILQLRITKISKLLSVGKKKLKIGDTIERSLLTFEKFKITSWYAFPTLNDHHTTINN